MVDITLWIGCGLLILGVGTLCFVAGWLACLAKARAYRATITTAWGTEQVYLGPLQALRRERHG